MEELDSLQMMFSLGAEQEVLEGGGRYGINTADLADFAGLVNDISNRVAERAAWDFVGALDLPPEQLGAMAYAAARRHAPRFAYRQRLDFAPGQVTQVAEGSIVLTTLLVGNLVVPWAVQHLFGEAVVAGWKESVGREKLKSAARTIFGGASAAAEEAAEQRPTRFEFAQYTMEPATESGGATRLSLGFRKSQSPDADAWRQGEELFGTAAEPRDGAEEVSEANELTTDGDLTVESEPQTQQANESEEERKMGA